MNKMPQLIGKWAAIISLFSILVWFVSFGMIAADGPLFYWTTPEAYFEYAVGRPQWWQNLAKTFMLIFSIGFFVMHVSFYEMQEISRKFAGKLGLSFLAMFALLSSMHYFIQISTVRLNIAAGSTEGLEHFIQANPNSFSLGINMLGWTIMLGLASLFLGLQFKNKGRQKWLKIFHFINAFFCLLAMVGFVLHMDVVTFPAINMGVGGCITVISVLGLLEMRK